MRQPAGLSPTEIPLGLLRPLCLKASFCAGHRAVSAAPPSLGLLQPAWPRLGAVPPPMQTPVSSSRGFLMASNAWHIPHSRFDVLNQIRYTQVTFTRTHLAPEPVARWRKKSQRCFGFASHQRKSHVKLFCALTFLFHLFGGVLSPIHHCMARVVKYVCPHSSAPVHAHKFPGKALLPLMQ